MTRANFVKKARKDYPDAGICKGESYYWWKFNFTKIKHFSKTAPKQSQLTQSPFLQSYYSILESTGEFTAETIQESLEAMINEVQELLDETQGSLENMPDHLQECSSAGELLTERIEALEGWVSDLENIDVSEIEAEEKEEEGDLPIATDDGKEEKFLEIMDGIGSCEPGL